MISEFHELPMLVRAEVLQATLRTHVLRPSRGHFVDFTHFLLIEAGQVAVETEAEDLHIDGPAALILPSNPAVRLTLGAGSPGWLLGASPGLMAEAVGGKAESMLLHRLVSRLVIAQENKGLTADFLSHAGEIRGELSAANRGSQMAVVAHLRLLLIAFWREAGPEAEATRGRGTEAQVIQGFRRLVELHFRKRISAAAYAEILGLSYDRLHDICARTMGRSPLQLVRQRLMREAAIRLERSGETVQEIAHSLGFSDPSQFSHFFKRYGQMSPSAFRARVRSGGDSLGHPSLTMADWP